ncbi:hypothetical protein [Staphylococcus massiliensis]|uniref:hypothetical protein n=1 Tax=Staphylococcus massiliensis TaxID=555791 RepID=UPI001EE0DCB7|nr:hypothetical protein [Staphylococcus massiliensis]MCG3400729.1 hypothetical protein [Staphylococcus massiliensis]
MKKIVSALSIVGLTLTLGGCGQSNVSSSDEKDVTTLTDVLNGKEERKIVMTEKPDRADSPEIK